MTRDFDDLDSVLRWAVSVLTDAGIDGTATDGRLLVAAAFGLSREDMLRNPGMRPDPGRITRLEGFIDRRVAREPVSRILGRREFRSLEFDIGPATLDPRPDSETLVEAVLEVAARLSHPPRLLDIGTGSGCLLLSILHELPAATGVGTDIASDAIDYARRNASKLGLDERAEFVTTNWADDVKGRFDIVLSNPPYIPTGDIPGLSTEVAGYDPAAALDGGADGLDAYRALSSCVGPVLASPGIVVVEIGAGQAADVDAVFTAAQFCLTAKRVDLAGRERVLLFSRNSAPNG